MGTLPYLGPVEALLQDADPAAQFGAACALAEWRGGAAPEILRGVAAGLAISDPEQNQAAGEVVRQLMALETLQRMGPDARAAVPEVERFAKQTPDPVLRDVALRAVAAMDPDAAQRRPEVGAVIAHDESRETLLERLRTGTYSSDDLSQALQEPQAAGLAVSRISDLGSAGKPYLAALQSALAGKDEATREEILAAMRAIDPDVVVRRVPGEPVGRGVVAVQLELDRQRATRELEPAAAEVLQKLIEPFRMGNTSWYTAAEVADLANRLRQTSPSLWEALMVTASESAPDIRTIVETGRKRASWRWEGLTAARRVTVAVLNINEPAAVNLRRFLMREGVYPV